MNFETRLGSLSTEHAPTADMAAVLKDNLDFQNGVRAFLNTIPLASMRSMRLGLTEAGYSNSLGLFADLMDSRTLFLTANTESVYGVVWLDLSDGPIVVEVPPKVLGLVDDAHFQYVADVGVIGPDKGVGGKYLFVPPGYPGEIPDGFFVVRTNTFGNWMLLRGFLVDGDPAPSAALFERHTRIYPLGKEDEAQTVPNVSGEAINTIHANDFRFFEEVNAVIQEEPIESMDPEILAILARIGIVKGEAFAPDDRMKALLTEAAHVANATTRTILFATRDPASFIFEDSSWITPFAGGSHEFQQNGVRFLDGRIMFFYYATGITPAMAFKMVGAGSQYGGTMVDADGNHLDGGRTYKLTIPANAPAKDFWSIVVYDNQTRSMLQTDQRFPSLDSQRGVEANADGSTDVYFGPAAPEGKEGKEGNWIQTIPGKGFSTIFRLYGPLEPWFEQTWQPGEVHWMREIPSVEPTDKRHRYATEIPDYIPTDDHTETRIGPIDYFDGYPKPDTVARMYDNLDFMRGLQAFLSMMQDDRGEPLDWDRTDPLSFYQALQTQLAQRDRSEMSPEWLGLLAAIGVYHDRPFNPDDEIKARLKEAAVVGAATLEALGSGN